MNRPESRLAESAAKIVGSAGSNDAWDIVLWIVVGRIDRHDGEWPQRRV